MAKRILNVSSKKTLKLTNVIKCNADFGLLNEEEIVLEKLIDYIYIKNKKPVGPLIEHTIINASGLNDSFAQFEFLLQCDNYIKNADYPFISVKELVIKNCMYCHYEGPENKMQLATNKIIIEAFENNIELKNEIYTVLIEKKTEDCVIVDVFMPKIDKDEK